ncbi:hypothetical protein AQJ67_04875 [Streptomyces caeruleatus]|uniref:Methyltransferase type 11 n=1 Tax=Streptomyces caeruleatus TaxID=661399 RepID=A0A101U8Q1_9ACTN|nr:hypothetical protein AQJ67_04875 [Streptomyces caeruleatus]
MLDCPGGASDFGARIRELGGRAVSADPQYALSPQELGRLVDGEQARVNAWVHAQPDRFGLRPGAPWPLAAAWRATAEGFLSDYRRCRTEGSGHYVSAALPALPFPDREFTLVISGFLLFSYTDRFDLDFHLSAVRELLRVCCGQVRLHPLNDSSGRPYPYMRKFLDILHGEGVTSRLLDVTSSSDPRDDRTLVLVPRTVTR